MSEPKQQHYIRIDLPEISETDRDRVAQAVIAVLEGYEEEFMEDIPVSGGAWYPPEVEESIKSTDKPIIVAKGILRGLLYLRQADNSPIDAALLRDALQELANLGMSAVDLQIQLERERAVNSVVLRNMRVEQNLLDALDMVTGNVSNPRFRIAFWDEP